MVVASMAVVAVNASMAVAVAVVAVVRAEDLHDRVVGQVAEQQQLALLAAVPGQRDLHRQGRLVPRLRAVSLERRVDEGLEPARVVHAVIKNGVDYRPFIEVPVPGGRTPLSGAVRAQNATL